MTFARDKNLSILIIDDDDNVLSFYERYLPQSGAIHVDCCSNSQMAKKLAAEFMYDAILCDVKFPYRGAQFGGLVLGEEMARRRGSNAVLLISEIVDVGFVHAYGSHLPFVRKPQALNVETWFSQTLPKKLRTMLRRQYGFVAMPFGDKRLNALYRREIMPAIKEAGFKPIRADKAPTTRSLTEKLFQRITDAHFVLVLASGLNPNVLYEGGFAHGVDKHSVTCLDANTVVPFDLRDHYRLNYADDGAGLSTQIVDCLRRLRTPAPTT